MNIYGLLKEEHVFLDLKPGDKKHVLEEFVSALKERGLVSKGKSIFDEILKRENLGSTGVQKGIAIPHALIGKIKKPLLALALIKKGVNFDAVDHLPTHVIFLLLGDKDNPGLQLRLLARICRLVKETKFGEEVRKAGSSSEVCSILKAEEEKI
jgi:mannitol/fructose-specific phosphotransferase system IIA component (Ntr-type)